MWLNWWRREGALEDRWLRRSGRLPGSKDPVQDLSSAGAKKDEAAEGWVKVRWTGGLEEVD